MNSISVGNCIINRPFKGMSFFGVIFRLICDYPPTIVDPDLV